MGRSDPREAVVAAEAGTRAWRQAVDIQRTAAPDHTDFYALAGELVDTPQSPQALIGVLSQQVCAYDQDRVLRDDAGMAPQVRLCAASSALNNAWFSIIAAERSANRFCSRIGHIGVEEL